MVYVFVIEWPAGTDRGLVIYQCPRPGPPLPKGESYLTIGWKQVNKRFYGLKCSMFTLISDLGSSQDLQIPPVHLCVPFCLFPVGRCEYLFP